MVKIMVALDFLSPFPASHPKHHVFHAMRISNPFNESLLKGIQRTVKGRGEPKHRLVTFPGPASDPAGDPGGDSADDPASDPAGDPAGDPGGDPHGDSASCMAGDPGGDPAGDPASYLAGDPGGDPAGDPASDQASDPGGDPTVTQSVTVRRCSGR